MSDVVDRIISFDAGRNPELLAIKYQKMRQDVFAFFRGTCRLFYEDLPANSSLNNAPPIWICGDLHLQNLAIYQGDDGLIYFDVNDFDESLLAPSSWDLIRFLTSILLSFPEAKSSTEKLLSLYLDSYTDRLAKGQIRSIHTTIAAPPLRRVMQKRQRRSQVALLNEYSSAKKKTRRLKVKGDKTRAIDEQAHHQAMSILKSWSDHRLDEGVYKVHDIATRLSGLGSMGVERYLVLVEGEGSPDKNHLLEIKQRMEPSAQPYSPQDQPRWVNAAERVVTLQNRLQAVSPTPFVALTHAGNAYTLRELYPADTKIELEDFRPMAARSALIEAIGTVTAYAHLRGCGRQGAASIDELTKFVAEPGWRKAVLDYVRHYSHQVKADFKAFRASDLDKGH